VACPSDPGYSAALTLTAWLLQIARILCTDTPQSIYYTAMLLRRYHSYLTAMEQALLLARVEQLTAQHAANRCLRAGRRRDSALLLP